jgi:hypothetical protein
MSTESAKYREVESRLPPELRTVYCQMVQQYEFLTNVQFGRGYVAYAVLAEMVLAGWRPSGEVHPSSQLAGGKQGDK